MDTYNLPELPLGTSNFSALRDCHQIYVDKTDLVYEIASKRRKFLFIRPRRFGKSLLLSTFRSLFRRGLSEFKGLKIEHLWKEQNTYRVVNLDFSNVKDFSTQEEFQSTLNNYFCEALQQNNLLKSSEIHGEGLSTFKIWLSRQEINSIVLLIDEYDAPLTACLNNKELFAYVRRTLLSFYATIKEFDGAFRFVFVTGITKFNNTGIFSGLNNFDDISLSPKFGSLLGYTHEEVKEYFSGYLSNAQEVLGLDSTQLMSELSRWYEGYCFERTTSQKVFPPWSLLKFFDEPERKFENYWISSGGRITPLTQYLKSQALKHPSQYGEEKSIPVSVLEGSSDLDSISDIALLTQAGYLTLKHVDGDTAFVGFPNKEVKESMAKLYTEQLLKGKSIVQVGATKLIESLTQANAEEAIQQLNKIFLSIDYMNYPITNEYLVRAFTQVFLAGCGLEPKVENHNAFGRSDLEVAVGDKKWVFEFKFCKESTSENSLLEEGVTQMAQREYGKESSAEDLIRVVAVFSQQKKKFSRWEQV